MAVQRRVDGVTAETYREVGGLEPLVALEDEASEAALIAHGVPITRSLTVRVTTSARLGGRAERGLAHAAAVGRSTRGA